MINNVIDFDLWLLGIVIHCCRGNGTTQQFNMMLVWVCSIIVTNYNLQYDIHIHNIGLGRDIGYSHLGEVYMVSVKYVST